MFQAETDLSSLWEKAKIVPMSYISQVWQFLLLTAPYFLLGLAMSGLMFGFVSIERLRRHLGGEKFSAVFKASVFGVPLPLCSCSVIPAALTLKKSGAGNGSTSAFLIATPETGVDSVMVTYAMMDFPMTLIRPFAAFLSSMVAGVLQIFFNPVKTAGQDLGAHAEVPTGRKSWREIAQFIFVDLLDDMSLWLTVGILAGAAIQLFVPDHFFVGQEGLLYRLGLLAICLSIYVCASATTPLVASLVMKGMTPGVGLLILLAGPAINLSNILVLQKHLGKKTVALNILAISAVALGLSYVVDGAYEYFNWPILFHIAQSDHEHGTWWEHASAAVMSLLLLGSLAKLYIIRPKKTHTHHHGHDDHCCAHKD